MSRPIQTISRRSVLGTGVSLGAGLGMSPLFRSMAAANENAAAQESAESETSRHCIMLWMSGGPSQLDTFDMKPGHPNGGKFKEVSTSVPGLKFSEHLPKLGQQAERLALLRGMSTKEGDHQRGTTVMRTGHAMNGPVRYPAIGCSLSKSLDNGRTKLPRYVTIAPGAFTSDSLTPGFLGPRFAPTSVRASGAPPQDGFASLRVDHMNPPEFLSERRHQQRLQLWDTLQKSYLKDRPVGNGIAQDTVYRAAIDLLSSEEKEAFDLSGESDSVRESYGRETFGQGCLMARRLVERGVPLVEITLGDGLGWDTHADNFDRVEALSKQLDAAWSTLMNELEERGLLDRTTIVCAGEFGRTPAINASGGRDHFPQAFTCVLAGGGVAGGQAYGATSEDGMEVIEGKIDQHDLLATLCAASGVDPSTENIAEGGRPIAIAEGTAIEQVLL